MRNYFSEGVCLQVFPSEILEADDLRQLKGANFSHYKNEDGNLHFYFDEYFDEDIALPVFQNILKRLTQSEYPYIQLEVAYLCNKPHLNGFGGYGLHIERDKVKSVSTGSWLQKMRKDYHKRIK